MFVSVGAVPNSLVALTDVVDLPVPNVLLPEGQYFDLFDWEYHNVGNLSDEESD